MKKILFLFTWLSLTIACKQVQTVVSEPVAINDETKEGKEIDEGRELPPNERFG